MSGGPKPKKRRVSKVKGHSRESNAFSKSIKNNKPGTLCCIACWILPSISPILSPMNCSFFIRFERTDFMRLAMALATIFFLQFLC